MKLLEDIILEDGNTIRIVSYGSKLVVLEALADLDIGDETDIGNDEAPDVFDMDMDSDVLSRDSIKKVANDVQMIASKVKNLQDSDVKDAANTVLNSFIRVMTDGKSMSSLEDFIKKVAEKIKGFAGDKHHPGYLGIKLVWKPLAHIVDSIATMTESVELRNTISSLKQFIVESKIEWKTGSIII